MLFLHTKAILHPTESNTLRKREREGRGKGERKESGEREKIEIIKA
jgi:hypothetical protein